MTWFEVVAILLAGVAAGTINTVVGSGTLITFPTLLAFGVPPVTANVSNTVGLVPGTLSGTIGYRRELSGQRDRVLRLAVASLTGGVIGAVLLLVLPASAFSAIVPVLILLGCVLVLFQPRISAWVARRHEESGGLSEHGAWWVWPLVLLTGVYGGYFGAAQGVLLMAILGIGVPETLQRLNATKNVLAAAGQRGRRDPVHRRRRHRLDRGRPHRRRIRGRRPGRGDVRPPAATGRAARLHRRRRCRLRWPASCSADVAAGLSRSGAAAHRWVRRPRGSRRRRCGPPPCPDARRRSAR